MFVSNIKYNTFGRCCLELNAVIDSVNQIATFILQCYKTYKLCYIISERSKLTYKM